MKRFLLVVLLASVACAPSVDVEDARPAPSADIEETRPDPSPVRTKGAEPAAASPEKVQIGAARLAQVEGTLGEQIDAWVSSSAGRRSPAWKTLAKQGLRAQKMYRRFAANPGFGAKVAKKLDHEMEWRLEANLRASARLTALSPPLQLKPGKKPHFPSTRPESPRNLLRYFEKAGERFDVPWYILASVNLVETRFGRLTGPSSSGALGPMQFMPATWEAYGKGDIMDPRDSIMGAARYLKASGAPDRMHDALFAYNRSNDYVAAILVYARQMKAGVQNYYRYYLWQVFVRTNRGDMQLTGPGSE